VAATVSGGVEKCAGEAFADGMRVGFLVLARPVMLVEELEATLRSVLDAVTSHVSVLAAVLVHEVVCLVAHLLHNGLVLPMVCLSTSACLNASHCSCNSTTQIIHDITFLL